MEKISDWWITRSIFFIFNVLLLLLLSWLTLSSIIQRAEEPSLHTIAIVISIVLLLPLVVLGEQRLNRIIFITLVTLFLIGETAARVHTIRNPLFYNTQIYHSPAPYIGFSGRPNTTFTSDTPSSMGGTVQDASFTLNELGFRGKLPSKKKENEIRIIMIGGSAVFHGAPLSNSIAGQLELLFHKDGRKNVRVYNWGVVTFVSGQELTLLLHTVADYNPDLVIVYDGGNDVMLPYHFDPRPGYPYNWFLYEAGVRSVRGDSSLAEILAGFLAHSKLLATMFESSLATPLTAQIDILRTSVDFKSRAWKARIVDTYIHNLRKMCVVGSGFGVKVAFFLQPLVFFKEPLVGKERALTINEEFKKEVTESYEQIRNKIEQETQFTGPSCSFVDMSTLFSHYDKEAFWDLIHVDNAGNQFVAQHMHRRLQEKEILNF